MAESYVYEHVVTPQDSTVLGMAYDGSYVEWACTARERMIIDNVDTTHFTWPGFLTGEIHLRYISPAFLNDRVEVRVNIGDVSPDKGRARLIFRFVNKASQQLLAEGYQVIFFANPTDGKRIPIPDEFLKVLDIFGAGAT
ncbi:MAG: thioesterase family protein [Chloroflexota bacterium]|nr:thioesterase family protein [Chloroflexota bacterium]